MPSELHLNKRGTATFRPIGGVATNLRVASSDESVFTLGAMADANKREVRPQKLGDATVTATYDGESPNMTVSTPVRIIEPGASGATLEITENP